ncbi:probable serine/threonine-protein kinase DDB_G0282963 isoform X1 [Leptopilina heterotoma]|uniref:probable serine/threonine-protein kinase DDB_G0282963 isoform X1 n=1 Tax=Leptopilina heterotoma TaxID=63436 RepID=UPI001CA83882|nr:probable serine/threonine-protein kinase DDB_G0282963 isoform X1 [Leptopilina heterotoma]
MKCKLFYVLLVASTGNIFLTNVTNGIVINQSSRNVTRNQSNSELSKRNSIVEDSGLKKIAEKEATNLSNIKKPNDDYSFHKKSQSSKFLNKSSKNEKRIERHIHRNNNQKKRGCKKICYPICCNYGHPYYLNNIYNSPYEIYDSPEEGEEEEEEEDFSDYEENFCSEDEDDKTQEDEEDKKKKTEPGEGGTNKSNEPTGKASGGTNKFGPGISATKENHLQKLFSELKISEKHILLQTVSKILREYNSTLKENYKITNLKEIFQNSHVETMLINSIRNVLKKDYEEHSIKWITDEIIQSALINFVINNDSSTKNSQKTLIPIAEGSFKIGQWIHNNENHESWKEEKNEKNQFNIETQITPTIHNDKLGNEISLTVNSGTDPLKTKFSIEIEKKNTKSFPSESEVIDNLPTQYYSQESKILGYRKNNENSDRNSSNQNILLTSERETKEQDQFSQVSSNKSNSQFEKTFHGVSNGNINNPQFSSSLNHQEIAEKDLNQSKNRHFNEKIQYHELHRNKKHTNPETNTNQTLITTERNIYKNPQIIHLLMSDQKKFAFDKNSSSKLQSNSPLPKSTRSANSNSGKKNNKFIGVLGDRKNIVNDDNFQKTTGIEKIGQIGSRIIDKISNSHFNLENNVKEGKLIDNDLPSLEALIVSNTSVAVNGSNILKKNKSKYRNSYVLGKLVPKNKENSEFLYKGNLLRLPIKLSKLNDGSFLVTLLNKIRNCTHKSHSGNQSGINKRDSEGKTLEKDESPKQNFNDTEIDAKKPKEYLKEANLTTSPKEDKFDEHEQYKQYLETLLDVNDIPTSDRSVVITNILEKKIFNSEESNLEISKNNGSKKDYLKNNLIIEKITFKPNKQNRNINEYRESSTNNVNAAVDIIKNLLNWLQEFILTTLNVEKKN